MKIPIIRSAIREADFEIASRLINEAEAEGYPATLLDSLRASIPANPIDENRSSQYCPPHENHTGHLGTINQTPLVSIIIVSYNSSPDLTEVIASIQRQSYKLWEIVLVDNGTDGADSLVKSLEPSTKIVKSRNMGFAEGNNVGLDHAEGELILLLNPDACLEVNCIKNMVHALRMDSHAAAVSPKIYFYKPFLKLRTKSIGRQKYNLSLAKLRDQLTYPKLFVLTGRDEGDKIASNASGEILVDFSPSETQSSLELDFAFAEGIADELTLSIDFAGSSEKPTIVGASQLKAGAIKIDLTPSVQSSSRYLINNAGSGIRECGSPYDIGFGQEDIGQFSQKAYVEALCGCCVLLRRDLFVKRKIFISEFFAYYEDSELSHWITSNRMRILYDPSSIVYHKHSTTTDEKSDLWTLLVNRGRLIYNSIVASPKQKIVYTDEALEKLKQGLAGKYNNLLATLDAFDNELEFKSGEELAIRKFKAIGIYNSYWNSLGGGEKHALDFASKALAKENSKVFLISERQFSVHELVDRFDVDLTGVKKLVCGTVTTALTERFDVFINSTYRSSLNSRSPNSYYIVSFPQEKLTNSIKDSYTFLHNSAFTARWAEKFWGKHKNSIIYPVQSLNPSDLQLTTKKKVFNKTILSVGRFNYSGHCKNQHEIIRAYIHALEINEDLKDWRLALVGACNNGEPSSVSHLNDCFKMADGYNIDIYVNASRKAVRNLYEQSSIYVHAAGLGINQDLNPELCEHFGIAVFEALANGCVPIVHSSGGPYAQCSQLPHAYFFENKHTLISSIANAVSIVNADNFEGFSQQSRNRAMSIYSNAEQVAESLFSSF